MRLSPEWAEGERRPETTRAPWGALVVQRPKCCRCGLLLVSRVCGRWVGNCRGLLFISRVCGRWVGSHRGLLLISRVCGRWVGNCRGLLLISRVYGRWVGSHRGLLFISRVCGRWVGNCRGLLFISRVCGRRGGTTLLSPQSGPSRTTGRRWFPAPGPDFPARRREPSGCPLCRGRR